MQQIFKTKIFVLLFIVLASSCSRSINGIPFGRVKHVKQIETISSVAQKQSDENLTASVDETTPVIAEKKYSIRFEPVATDNNAEECDTIILKTGERIGVKVLGTDKGDIKYKPCNDLNGETYSINQSKVLAIKFSNPTAPYANRMPHWAVIAGWILLALFIISFATVDMWSVTIGFGVFVFFQSVLFIAAMILGIIGYSATNKHPDLFSGRGFSILLNVILFIAFIPLLLLMSVGISFGGW